MLDSSKPFKRDFNPRSPHGERPALQEIKAILLEISIHAPRTGSDCIAPTFG